MEGGGGMAKYILDELVPGPAVERVRELFFQPFYYRSRHVQAFLYLRAFILCPSFEEGPEIPSGTYVINNNSTLIITPALLKCVAKICL
jgi:hypothetical protein